MDDGVSVGVCANAPSAEINYTANEQRELMDMRMRNGRGDGADEMVIRINKRRQARRPAPAALRVCTVAAGSGTCFGQCARHVVGCKQEERKGVWAPCCGAAIGTAPRRDLACCLRTPIPRLMSYGDPVCPGSPACGAGEHNMGHGARIGCEDAIHSKHGGGLTNLYVVLVGNKS